MTQKEKARAYDEAIKRAEKFNIDDAYASQGTIVKSIFPQLKESDDERIIRAIYEAIKDVRINTLEDYNSSGKEALAWLESQFKEKQKKQKYYWKPTETDVALFNKAVTTNKTLTTTERTQLDIIRSKFGCCRASNCSGIFQEEQKQILEVFGFKVGDAVRLKDGDGRKHIIKSFEEVEGLHGPNFYNVEFEDNSAVDGIYPGEEYPNGYYTQMEKIDDVQKPIKCIDFDNEFENLVSYFIASALNREYEYNKDFVEYAAHSLLRYAEKEQKPSIFPPAWEEVRWNPISSVQNKAAEWSEEDERILKGIIGKIDHDQTYGVSKVEMLSFLKSLRSHWKPTKEQMDALEEVIVLLRNLRRNTDDRKNLEALREQLGKL